VVRKPGQLLSARIGLSIARDRVPALLFLAFLKRGASLCLWLFFFSVRKALSSEPFVPWGRYQALRGRVISDYSRLLLVVLVMTTKTMRTTISVRVVRLRQGRDCLLLGSWFFLPCWSRSRAHSPVLSRRRRRLSTFMLSPALAPSMVLYNRQTWTTLRTFSSTAVSAFVRVPVRGRAGVQPGVGRSRRARPKTEANLHFRHSACLRSTGAWIGQLNRFW